MCGSTLSQANSLAELSGGVSLPPPPVGFRFGGGAAGGRSIAAVAASAAESMDLRGTDYGAILSDRLASYVERRGRAAIAESLRREGWLQTAMLAALSIGSALLVWLVLATASALRHARLEMARGVTAAGGGLSIGHLLSHLVLPAVTFALIGASLVLSLCPQATGSGLQQTLLTLDGVNWRGAQSARLLIVKALALPFSLGAVRRR